MIMKPIGTTETPSANPLTINNALQQAIIQHQTGNLQEAECLYRSILEADPKHPDANHNMGVLAVQLNQTVAGLPLFKAALEANPNNGQYWLSYIDALMQTGQTDAARQVLEKGRQGGLNGESIEVLAGRLEKESPRPQEMNTLTVLFDEGRYEEATTLAHTLTISYPQNGFGWKALGVLRKFQGLTEESLEPMQKAVALMPMDSEAHNNMGNTLKDLGRLEEAEASCRRALELKPDFAEAHNNLGATLKDMGQLDEAEACCRRALVLKPDFAEAHNNMGAILKDLWRLEEAEASCRRALELKLDYAEAYNNLGFTQHELGCLKESETSYRRVLEIMPDLAEARFALGQLLLYLGNFEEGWNLYESRYDLTMGDWLAIPAEIVFSQWQGETISGKTLLIFPEQGLGDQIQFCRYLPILKAQGVIRITLVCQAPLKSLFERLVGADEVLTLEEANSIKPHDYWTHLASIPLYCKTRLDNVPAEIPYLYADRKLQQDMAERLADISGFKVGICWQGSRAYKGDEMRSPGIGPFKALFRSCHCAYFSLQSGGRDEFLSAAGSVAVDLGHEIDAFTQPFEETAALIMNLDLVITSDTSIAHLAGALGKTVWVVLPFVSDWRWMADREDNQWYPNTRLFRQKIWRNWDELFERVALRLNAVIAGECPALWPLTR